jgi:hypothetical protein
MIPLQEVLLSPIVSREPLFACRQVDRIVWRSMVPQECPLRIGQMAYFRHGPLFAEHPIRDTGLVYSLRLRYCYLLQEGF